MALQNDPGISLSNASIGSLSTEEPYRQLHIQHTYAEHQHTSSKTLMLTTSNATPTHKVSTNFVLDLMQHILGADRPSGLQACATANQR